MKAVRITNSGLVESETPQPVAQAGEILVRVHAAGITPTELAWYPTSHTRDGGPRMGAVPSHEFSGETADGQPVYGINDWFADGALAEYCVTRPEWVAPKPQTLTHAEAASVPIGALTAWQGLFDRAHLQAGERVLIHGGAGAVGVFAIQLAHHRGARVITTVSAHHIEFVHTLGADQVIDYRAGRFEDQVRDLDVVFDAVGGDILARSWSVLKPGGRLVTIASTSETTTDERAKAAFFIVETSRAQLIEIAGMLDAGKLRAVVDAQVPFSQAPAAYTGGITRQGRGKVVVLVAAAAAPVDARAGM